MSVRTFTLNDGVVTIRRSDDLPWLAWHCVISRPPFVRTGMAATARDALRLARVGKTAVTMSIALPPAAPDKVAQAGDSETVPLAAIRARIEHAREESMALRHLIGTKDMLAALDVLVNEAVRAQALGLLEFRLIQMQKQNEELSRGQARLQAELDALRAQIAEGKAEPETTSAQDATKTPEPAPVNSGEAIDPVPTQEASP